MNKQALAFLTLFSLILMLSVYYVTLPNDVTAVISEDTQEQEKNQTDTSKQEDEGGTLQDTIIQKIDEQLHEASSVMADKNSSESEKQAALSALEQLEKTKEEQQQIQDLLKEQGFSSAVEISDGTCRITLYDCEEKKENVNKAMNIAYLIVKQKYLLEVTFKTS